MGNSGVAPQCTGQCGSVCLAACGERCIGKCDEVCILNCGVYGQCSAGGRMPPRSLVAPAGICD